MTTDELLDETKAILDINIQPFFDETIHKREVVNKQKPKQKEIEDLLKKKVKFLEDDDDNNNNESN